MEIHADVLLVTVTDVETRAVFDAFCGKEPPSRPIGGKVYHDLGIVNDASVWHVRSEMGAGNLGASHQTVTKAIAALSPSAVIMAGIAFGVDGSRQQIGDVLISQRLALYGLQWVGTADGQCKIALMGSRPDASPWLLDCFRNAGMSWKIAPIRFGCLLTGEKLVDNLDFRNQLSSLANDADLIGGEMEGGGLYTACQDAKVDWMVVKAICDWADGKKEADREQRQQLAATNAAAFVLHTLKTISLKRKTSDPEDTAALRRYREWVVRQCAHIDLGDLGSAADAGRSGGRLKLARVYVELDTTSRAEPEEEDNLQGREKADTRELHKEKKLTAVGSLFKHRRLALLGLPGAGKSTFIRRLSLHLAAQPLPSNQGVRKELKLENLPPVPDWPAAEVELIPITVVLRRFAAECAPKGALGENATAAACPQTKAAHACHLWDFIQSNLREENLADAAKPIREALESGRAIVFFDGLDEVPDDDQKQFVCQAVDLFASSAFAPSRMVLTCRTFSYRNQGWTVPDFNEVELAELDDKKIQQFIPAWFEALAEEGVMTAEQSRHKSSTLWPAIRERGLRELAGNPLQLTNMAVLHRVETLPDNRALLYDRLVRLLLLQWDKVRFDKDKLAVPLHALRDEADCREDEFVDGVAWLAWQVHDPRRGGQPGQPADISEFELRGALERLHPSQDISLAGLAKKADWALRVVRVFRQRGALLREEGRGVFKFPHRSYQEFLAGTHLAQQPDFAREAAAHVDDSRHWWEVVRWAANYMAYVKRSTHNTLGLAAELCADAQQGKLSPLAWRKVYLAGDILAEIGVSQVRRCRGLGDTCLAQTRQLLERLVEFGDAALPVRERAIAAITLGKLGDPRLGVGLRGDGLPDIDWIEVPAGPFPMGEDKPAAGYNDETPRFFCKLIPTPYRVSRYPVTVAQYQAFVDAGGYTDNAKEWWTEAGWKWKLSEKRTEPSNCDAVYQTPNHPRVGVSWFEAVAFCRWLTGELKHKGELKNGEEITLPSEAQWERAARHTDGRTFPWGNEEECQQRCNMGETGIGHTSAVGLFPGGNAECGAADMAGNVREWCRTKWLGSYQGYEQKVDDRLEGSDARVMRGGSFGNVRDLLRCALRFYNAPDTRNGYVGFRVVLVAGGSAP